MSTPNEKFADHRFQFSSPGLGKTGQYQMSGIPFLSSSFVVDNILAGPGHTTEISFPYVTKFITVRNDGARDRRAVWERGSSEDAREARRDVRPGAAGRRAGRLGAVALRGRHFTDR